jgi:uncharacterized protein (DUF1697 family)
MPSTRPVRLVAFLRAINVGGANVVKMDALRAHVEALGFTNVETFIASGNVVFSSRATDVAAIERKIERGLQSALGYEVKTFVRTDAEIAAIAAHKPFAAAAMQSCAALNVGFLAAALDPAAVKTLMAFKTEIDDFHVNGREVYWICRKRQSDSRMNNARFEKLVKASATFRGMKTIARLVERLK